MKGLQVAEKGAPFEVVDGIKKPSPGPNEVLVKSLVVGANPVDTLQRTLGMLVQSWPIVLGCDASGVVVEVGSAVTKFKPGDYVCGCSRLGWPGYCTYQEYFLMDEPLTILKPSNMSVESAATVGTSALKTACLGLNGLCVPIPTQPQPEKDEWIVIFGGSGGVGQFAVQLSKIAGYKVIASCSQRTAEAVRATGADATFDYSLSEEDQLAEIVKITRGYFSRVFDAVAKSASIALLALTKGSRMEPKFFTSTDDWTPMDPVLGVNIDRISLGPIGSSGEALKENPTLNEDVAGWIPKLYSFFEQGTLKPLGYQIIGDESFESITGAIDLVNAGKTGGKKLIVRIQQV